jgi:hypothetical protein
LGGQPGRAQQGQLNCEKDIPLSVALEDGLHVPEPLLLPDARQNAAANNRADSRLTRIDLTCC